MHTCFMRQALLLIGVLAAMFSIVPLAILAATGSLRAAWEAARGYALVMLLITGPGLVIGLLAGGYELIAH